VTVHSGNAFAHQWHQRLEHHRSIMIFLPLRWPNGPLQLEYNDGVHGLREMLAEREGLSLKTPKYI
jgi:hypothetical protein